MMEKHKLYYIYAIVLISVAAVFAYCFLSPRFSATDFPLGEAWEQHFDGEVLDISKSNDNLSLFVRTTYSLYALDVNNGKILWKFSLAKQVDHSPPISLSGKVYITDSQTLWALNAKSGEVIWAQPLSETGGRLIDASDKIVLVNQVGYDVKAYDADIGSFLWSVSSGRGFIQGYIGESIVYIPDHGVKAIDVATGNIVWQYGSEIIGSSVYYAGTVYFTSGGKISAFNTQSQTELWSTNQQSVGLRRLKLEKAHLFIMDENNFYVVNRSDGTFEWQVSMPHPTNPVVIGDNVYVMEGFTRVIRVLSLSTGKETGHIRASLPRLLVVDNQDMFSIKDILLFSTGQYLFAYAPPNR